MMQILVACRVFSSINDEVGGKIDGTKPEAHQGIAMKARKTVEPREDGLKLLHKICKYSNSDKKWFHRGKKCYKLETNKHSRPRMEDSQGVVVKTMVIHSNWQEQKLEIIFDINSSKIATTLYATNRVKYLTMLPEQFKDVEVTNDMQEQRRKVRWSSMNFQIEAWIKEIKRAMDKVTWK